MAGTKEEHEVNKKFPWPALVLPVVASSQPLQCGGLAKIAVSKIFWYLPLLAQNKTSSKYI